MLGGKIVGSGSDVSDIERRRGFGSRSGVDWWDGRGSIIVGGNVVEGSKNDDDEWYWRLRRLPSFQRVYSGEKYKKRGKAAKACDQWKAGTLLRRYKF